MMNPPSDPLFNLQTHFNLIGDIQTIWDEYSGTGVSVGVYDDGIDFNHEDLSANYDASLEVVDDNGITVDPAHDAVADGHGTSVAGLIAAANNGTGTVGVAHGASLTGVNIFGANAYGYVNSGTAAGQAAFLDVVSQATNFDIMNNSWGSFAGFGSSGSLQNPTAGDTLLANEYDLVSQNGRDGLGTVIIQSAGNDTVDANGDGTNATRFTSTIAATDLNGNAADFSNFGHSILVSAPAANVTTDITGNDGYNGAGVGSELADVNYTQTFGGTSAAAPVTSGIVALMLEANETLGWRDVQNILALSASHTGSALNGSATGFEQGDWFFNGANNWNGGGAHFNVSYGYGIVDAFAAVRMAEAWSLFNESQTSSNEISAVSSTFAPAGGQLVTGAPGGVTFNLNFGSDIDLEHVGLILDLDTAYIGDLQVTLTSAEGTTITVYAGNSSLGTDVNGGWYFGIDSLLGENAKGVWTVNIQDTFEALDDITLNSAQLEFYGAESDNNDVFHFTDEIKDLILLDPSRLQLSDEINMSSAGGVDWLNFAALTDNLTVDLATNGNGFASIAGFGNIVELAGDGTVIENVVTGDGNDSITGNQFENVINGARGNDVINAAGGNDTIFASLGFDTIDGGVEVDTFDLSTSTGVISNWVNLGVASAQFRVDSGAGFAGRATLTGIENVSDSAGNDRFFGDGDENTYFYSAGLDTVDGNGGFDTLDYSGLLRNFQWLDLQASSSQLRSNDGTGFVANARVEDVENFITTTQIDHFRGDAGDQTVQYRGGRDFINGREGSDRIDFSEYDNGNWVNLNIAFDQFRFFNGAGFQSGGNAQNIEEVTGGDGNDFFFADAEDNFYFGGLGNDRFDAGAGTDTFEVDGTLADYTLAGSGSTFTLSGLSGTDTLIDVEQVQIGDTVYNINDLNALI